MESFCQIKIHSDVFEKPELTVSLNNLVKKCSPVLFLIIHDQILTNCFLFIGALLNT